ncbi:MAG: TolC family protein [Bacteroidales bacterium]|nr:TolC family protein [Bacteroidales bacterium]
MKRNFVLIAFVFLIQINYLAAQNVLTLNECREMALKNNKSIKISEEKLISAQEKRKIAFTQFLPNFQATGTYLYNSKNISLLAEDALLPVGTMASDGSFTLRSDQMGNQFDQYGRPLDRNGVPFDPTTNPEKIIFKDYALLPKESMQFDIQNIFTLGIGFTQPIYMGGKILELYRISKIMEEMAKIQLDNSQVNLMVEVDEAYWRVVSLVNKNNLAKEYHQLLLKTSSNVDALVEEGVATKSDALKIKVKLNEAEMTLSKAENGLSLSKMLLCQICSMPIDTEFTLSDELLNQEISINNDINIANAINNRTETQLLDNVIKISKSAEKIAFSKYLPNIVGTGNYLSTNPNTFNGFEKSFGGMFSFGIGVQVPIFHWGENYHTLKTAKIGVRIAQLEKEEAVEKMELQINQMLFKVKEANKQKIMATNNIEKAKENLDSALIGFDSGVITTSDLMEAQTAYISAKSEKIDADINSIMTNVYLEKSLGNLNNRK